MVLKEAYRYQNYLTDLIEKAESYLMLSNFITETKENHMRSKVNSDAEDEEIVVPKIYNVDFTPTDLVDFMVRVLDEKQKLSDAISEAKKTTELDVDSAVSMNKIKQRYISVLRFMADKKSEEKIIEGKDYKFDINGEQKPYKYQINKVTTISYDRNNVRKLIKKYQTECDDISTKLDKIQLLTEVEFVPTWDIGDSLEDVVLS